MSSPSSPRSWSRPGPPVTMSFPACPRRRSEPVPPSIWSWPGPPSTTSLPPSPSTTSLPAPARITSLPEPPQSTSGLGVPMIRSSSSVPASVQPLAWASNVGKPDKGCVSYGRTRNSASGSGATVWAVISPSQFAVPSNSTISFARPELSTVYIPYSWSACAIVRHGPSHPAARNASSLMLGSSWRRAPSGTSRGFSLAPSDLVAGYTNVLVGYLYAKANA